MEEVRRPLNVSLPHTVLELSNAFKAAGHRLFLVGGAVRDAVLGIEPKDFDLATDATPDQVVKIIAKLVTYEVDQVGAAFGVVIARMKENIDRLLEHEIATFREDLTAGRHPEVRFATIKEDVQRRDLTINALFYDIDKKEVVDLVGGLLDIEEGVIRTVGDPRDRFAEDRLRILRALRFSARFGYRIAEETEKAILDDNDLSGISPERVRDEFLKAVASSHDVSVFLGLMSQFDMWKHVFPGLVVSRRNLTVRDPVVLLASLLEHNDVNVVAKALNSLRYSDTEVKKVTFLMNVRDLDCTNAYRLRRMANSIRISDDQVMAYVNIEAPHLSRVASAFTRYELTVKGDDLLAQGYSGKALGVELEKRELELFERLVGA